jgi:uncharacterized membrane protein (UPF0182 family)
MPTNPLFDMLRERPGQAKRPARPKPAAPRNTKRTVTIAVIVAAVVVALIILVRVLGFYLDWLWFGEVGFRTVFWRTFWSQILVGAAGFAVFFIILWPNLELARRMAPEFRAAEGSGGEVVEMVRVRARRSALWVGLGVSLVAALIAGYLSSRGWLTFINAIYAEPFGTKDPIFGHDIGFYIFSVPAWHTVQSFVFAALFVTLALTAAAHVALGGDFSASVQAPQQGTGQRLPRPRLGVQLPKRAVAHLSALLAGLFILLGVGQLFKAWGYLNQSSGLVFGVGYTDDNARIPAARILMVVAFVIAALLIFNIFRRVRWWPYTIVAWVGIFIVAQWIYPAIIQGLVVNPNELDKERTYLGHTLSNTKEAYALNSISARPLDMKLGIDAQTLKAAVVTVRNVRLWDPNTLVTSYRQLQELRPYYSFVDADVDRYMVNGVLRQTMLSARELNIAGLPAQAQTWVNQHITYTHGYGVTLSAVNQVTADGSPDFLVSDVPPQSAPGLEISQPRIYYGEIGTDYTLVGTTEREFDYPGAASDVFTKYKGSGGIPASPFLTKLALSWRFKTIKFFTSNAITGESRVILVNNIRNRLAKAAPFLTQERDPYMVIANGRLMWIVDCYTTTNLYPYSDSDGSLNYIRNSVKAVIDAYNGTIDLYVFDDKDPVLKTYGRAFPGLLKPLSEMPADILKHVRYPEGYFNVQARQYATYHVDNVDVLYNKGDQWQIPDNVALTGEGPMSAYYVILRLPEEQKEEFTLMLPFVPNGRKNMVSWLGARSDPPNYGKSVVILLAKGESTYGPSQVEAAINQDPQVSAQLTLWNQRGSTAIMGNLLVEPNFDSLIYIQPLYLQSEQTKLPQVKQVVVFYRSAPGVTNGPQGQFVAMKPTLREALAAIFGEAAGTTPEPTPGPTTIPTPGPTTTPGPTPTTSPGTLPADVAALINQANAQFEAAQAALRAGDFAEYGRQVELLKATLAQLETLR